MAQYTIEITFTRWQILRLAVPATVAALRESGLIWNPLAWFYVLRCWFALLFGGAA